MRQWNGNAPEWRKASPGLCLEGKCSNTSCKANGQMVIMNMGLPVVYHLNAPSQKSTHCPICKTYVQPITCAFNNCMWRYHGFMLTSNGPEKRSSDWTTADNSYHRFDESSNAKWTSLALEAKFDEAKFAFGTIKLTDSFDCVVCLANTYSKEIVQAPKCKHNFHLSCFISWKSKSSSCPVQECKALLMGNYIPVRPNISP